MDVYALQIKDLAAFTGLLVRIGKLTILYGCHGFRRPVYRRSPEAETSILQTRQYCHKGIVQFDEYGR